MYVVTGAAGFIGRHLVARLAADGHEVAAVDRQHELPAAAHHRWAGDLNEADADIDGLLSRAAAVFHLAGLPGVRDHTPDIEHRRWRDNVLAGRRVLQATPLSTPVIVTSSSSVYGGAVVTAAGLRPSPEHDRLRPRGGYATSKVVLERACEHRAARGGRVAVARPFTVVGEGQRADMAVASWIAAARRGLPMRLFGSPARTRDLTDVHDVVEGLVRMMRRGVTGVVNLGTGHGHRLDETARTVAEVLGVPARFEVLPVGAQEPPASLADTRRCADLLGFVPRTDLQAVVRRQVADIDTNLMLEIA